MKIIGESIYLKEIDEKNVTKKYLNWMNNKKITKYMETGKNRISLLILKNYVIRSKNSNNEKLFGIFKKINDSHIGNIKLNNIDKINKKAYLGIMIGDKQEWGKGYGEEAIKLCTNFAFSKLKLNKIKAGIIYNNIASVKLFEKCGFDLESRNKKDVLFGKRFVDTFTYVKFK